jgi:hypothetical protein
MPRPEIVSALCALLFCHSQLRPAEGGPPCAREGARENFARFNGYVSAYSGNAELTLCLNHTRKTNCAGGNECALIVDAYSPCDMAQPAEAAACPRVQARARELASLPGETGADRAQRGSRVHGVCCAPPAGASPSTF